jgi:G protein beta subunit-like protein
VWHYQGLSSSKRKKEMNSLSPVLLVTGGYDHKVRFWDVSSGVCSRTINFGESQVNCLAISTDKALLIGGGNPSLNIFDVNSHDDRPIISYDGHSNNIMNVGLQKDSRWIYSCSEDGSIRIWDPRSNVTARKYDCNGAVNSVALHPNEAEIISGDQNGVLKIWDLTADKCREEYIPSLDMPIRSISLVST